MQKEDRRAIASTLLESKKAKKPPGNKRLAPIKPMEIKNKDLVSPSPMGGTLTEGKAANFMDQNSEDKAYNS